jgi:hypothetical protein
MMTPITIPATAPPERLDEEEDEGAETPGGRMALMPFLLPVVFDAVCVACPRVKLPRSQSTITYASCRNARPRTDWLSFTARRMGKVGLLVLYVGSPVCLLKALYWKLIWTVSLDVPFAARVNVNWGFRFCRESVLLTT